MWTGGEFEAGRSTGTKRGEEALAARISLIEPGNVAIYTARGRVLTVAAGSKYFANSHSLGFPLSARRQEPAHYSPYARIRGVPQRAFAGPVGDRDLNNFAMTVIMGNRLRAIEQVSHDVVFGISIKTISANRRIVSKARTLEENDGRTAQMAQKRLRPGSPVYNGGTGPE